jgi:hypothetical protein
VCSETGEVAEGAAEAGREVMRLPGAGQRQRRSEGGHQGQRSRSAQNHPAAFVTALVVATGE